MPKIRILSAMAFARRNSFPRTTPETFWNSWPGACQAISGECGCASPRAMSNFLGFGLENLRDQNFPQACSGSDVGLLLVYFWSWLRVIKLSETKHDQVAGDSDAQRCCLARGPEFSCLHIIKQERTGTFKVQFTTNCNQELSKAGEQDSALCRRVAAKIGALLPSEYYFIEYPSAE